MTFLKPQGDGFMEFDNARGEVERLLVPFRALGDTLQDRIRDGYSRFDTFGFHPRQQQGFQEAFWEAWRLWQIGGFPDNPRPNSYKPEIRNIAASPGRGRQHWDVNGDDYKVKFEGSVRGMFLDLNTGVPQDSNRGFLEGQDYKKAVTELFEHLAKNVFPRQLPIAKPIAGGEQPRESFSFWPKRFWHHLIYAFFIEATRILPIYRKLIGAAVSSEEFGFFREPSQRWMRSTESLWRLTQGATEIVNDGSGASRRNAYWRLLGLDIDEFTGIDLPFIRAETANTSFAMVFEDLLYEVWNAFKNNTNTSGPNTTDPVAIVEICRTLKDMFNQRRLYGTLTREEYTAVNQMSWHYLVIDGIGNAPNSNSPVIVDMRVMATTPDERLRRLGEAVGVPAHPKVRSLLKLAERVSLLLIEIEQGDYDSEHAVRRLYMNDNRVSPGSEATTQDMLDIINEWSILTGRDVKAKRTAPQILAAQAGTPLLTSSS